MISFNKFKTIVRNCGGVWRSPSVRFSRTQSEYSARYEPLNPEASPEDSEIHCVAPGGLWSCRGPHGVSF